MKDYWKRPVLTVEGQLIFWDAQADGYEQAPMTVDNQPELEAVLDRCRQIVDLREIITLGGAVGCRDPKVILDELFHQNPSRSLPSVVFNDLAPKQVEEAKRKYLASYIERGVPISFLQGEIKIVCGQIGTGNRRRLLIGVYNTKGFFEACPDQGYPLCGFDEYLNNWETLGHAFLIEWVRNFSGEHLVPTGTRSVVSNFDQPDMKLAVKQALHALQKAVSGGEFANVVGLEIIGQHERREGFFLSHWYTPSGFLNMLREVFPDGQYLIAEDHFPKGMLYTIDPVGEPPQGVVTVLNNVIGNVLPHSQFETLLAIRSIL